MAVTRFALNDAQDRILYIVESNGPLPVLPAGVARARDVTGFGANPGDTFDGITLTKRQPTSDEVADANAQALLQKAASALATNATFQAIVSPNQAQGLAQIQALTKQMNALIKLAAGLLQDTDGT